MLIPGSYVINRYEIISEDRLGRHGGCLQGEGPCPEPAGCDQGFESRNTVPMQHSLRNSGWKPSPQQVYLIRTL